MTHEFRPESDIPKITSTPFTDMLEIMVPFLPVRKIAEKIKGK